ncbi:MAG TPA: hypothetical protein VK958_07380 [Methylophilus sp.]|jgi:hypothetical protein|uniref:hypothetical protein n=1 Tax=Methylophilus sp. TaxID=29541 RepID=UPI002BD086B8|nr:hypothetical protein [Methylophilus sp.]HSH87053.1 hypothetical protein [Methylophilus sp.]
MLKKLYLAIIILLITVTAHAEKNAWFAKSSKLLFSKELNTCHDHKVAGNLPLFNDCVTSKLNAYDVIKQKMDDPAVSPFFGDSVCVDKIRASFELGARCMAAALDICKQGSGMSVTNPLGCLRTFSGSTWQAHPSAMKLDFTQPARSEKEINHYVQ